MFAIYQISNGSIVTIQRDPIVRPGQGAFDLGEDWRTANGFYFPQGIKTERPSAPSIPTSGVAGMTIPESYFIAGTLVDVTNEAGVTYSDLNPFDTADPGLTFEDAGSYELTIKPPFPYVGFAEKIEVSLA